MAATQNSRGSAAGSPIRDRRKVDKLTQAELADAVGVSRQTIVAIEKGDYSPSVFLALRIARELDTTVEELFSTDANTDTDTDANTDTAKAEDHR